MAVSGLKGALRFFGAYPGGADCQFAQTLNLYGRGIVEIRRREVQRRCEMDGHNKWGTFPLVYGRRVMMLRE